MNIKKGDKMDNGKEPLELESFFFGPVLGGFLGIIDLASILVPFAIIIFWFFGSAITLVNITGLILTIVGLFLRCWACIYIAGGWNLTEYSESVSRIVTSGPYRYVRHPWYLANLLSVCGTCIAFPLYPKIKLILVLGTLIIIAFRISIQEYLLKKHFPEYRAYAARTKCFIPYLA